jgi:pheromone shutdown protein TraB
VNIITFLLLTILVSFPAYSSQSLEGTTVITIGTFHGLHEHMPHYSFEDLKKLIIKAKPDVLAIEARESDLKLPNYGKTPKDIREVAIPLAKEKGIPFCPIDWWLDGSREKHDAFFENLARTKDGAARIKTVGEEDRVHRPQFESYENMTIEYVHSDDFAQRDHKYRQMLTKTFGEGPQNLWWDTRTKKMAENLLKVVKEFPGKRIVVVTGAAHRGDLESALKANGIRVTTACSPN